MTPPLVTCPQCAATLNPKNVAKHLLRVHPAPQARQPVQAPFTDRPIRCVCGMLTTYGELLAHQRATHKPTDSGAGSRRSAKVSHPQTRSLDGSRDYYDKFPEGNRLGSHPSHDDYGDESFS